ncbi:MAG: hypothetical protein JNJ61_30870 [Anaerolineae bacterium]|nr:hypothetical protein [Anaerolineae bacterium]
MQRIATFRLWAALNHPPATHPIFRRTVLLPGSTPRRFISWASVMIMVVVQLGEMIPTVLFLLMPLLLGFTGLLYGVDCALRVSHAIAREHENNTYHLLALAPAGPLGLSWAICTSALYRNREFQQFRAIVRVSLIIGLIVSGFLAVMVMIGQSEVFVRFAQPAHPTIAHFLGIVGLCAVLYLEYVQSAILGCIVGMIIPTYTGSRLDASLFAFGVFLLLQVLVYLLAFFGAFVVLPSLYHSAGATGFYADISLTALRVGLFFAVRDAVITLSWRLLISRLNVMAADQDLNLRMAV